MLLFFDLGVVYDCLVGKSSHQNVLMCYLKSGTIHGYWKTGKT